MDSWKEEYLREAAELDRTILEQTRAFGGIVQDNILLSPEIEDELENLDPDDFEPVTPDAVLNQR